MLTITDWVPMPGRPMPVPRLQDDRHLFSAREVQAVLQWMEAWKREPHFDEVRIEGNAWRISELRCPLTHKQTRKIVAVHKFVCGRPVLREKIVIVGPYVGCFKHGEHNRPALV